MRHGESEGNAASRFGGHSPTPLSELGHRQAEATAKVLAQENVAAIYTSDLLRAVQTATPLAQLTGLEIKQTSAFRERSVGVMEGLTFEEAAAHYAEDYAALMARDFERQLTGGESYRQLRERASTRLDELIAKHAGETFVVFAHTGTISIMTLHLMGSLDAEHLRVVWVHTANCGVARFQLNADGFLRVVALNDTRHLIDLS